MTFRVSTTDEMLAFARPHHAFLPQPTRLFISATTLEYFKFVVPFNERGCTI
jgi:hypothetical protein